MERLTLNEGLASKTDEDQRRNGDGQKNADEVQRLPPRCIRSSAATTEPQ
jgi:hypothetical protein